MFKLIQFIGLLLGFISSGFAQVNHRSCDTISYVEAAVKGQRAIFSAVLHPNKKSIIYGSALTVIGTSLFFLDDEIQTEVQQHRDSFNNSETAELITHLGDPLVLIAIPALTWTSSKIFRNERLAHTSEVAALSLIHTTLYTIGIKALSGRGRPSDYDTPHYWEGPSTKHWSFPSFHAAGSWAVATAIARSYPEKKLLGILCYTSAAAVSLSRVYLNQHWSSDVFWGAALGFGVASVTVKTHRNNQFRFFPIFSPTTTGAGFNYQF